MDKINLGKVLSLGHRIVDFAHCRRHIGNDTKLVCFDGEEEGIENIAPDTLVRLG